MRAWAVFGIVGTGLAGAVIAGLAAQGCSQIDCNDDPECVAARLCAMGGAAAPPICHLDAGSDSTIIVVSDSDAQDTSVPGAEGSALFDASSDAVSAEDTADAPDAPDAPDVIPCDPKQTPAEEACVIDDAYGVFVSPSGLDTNPGTKNAPVRTVGRGLALAKAQSKRVYACGTGGTYAESLVITPSLDGVSAYGGLDCASWAYVASAKAPVAPTTPGYALSLAGLTAGATFEDFAFTAPAGVQPGDSSIAVFANGANNVVLTRCALTAGIGQPGVDKAVAAGIAIAAPGGQPGTLDAGGLPTGNTCAGVANASVGGAGGTPSATGEPGDAGTPGPANGGGLSGGACAAGSLENGVNGNGGLAGSGAAAWATIDSSGWHPVAGQPGGPGSVGQGGGGGASIDNSGGGGGGGSGGCGGVGGLSGSGGGSSVTLLAVNSTLDLEQCTLVAAAGGRGGNGAAGQVGQTRGIRANGYALSTACPGGNGGYGGSGGGGGGGAGGLSAGVVWSGTAPTVEGNPVTSAATAPNVTLGTAGTAGQPGAGGTAVATGANAGAPATDNAMAGVGAAVLQLQ